MRYFSSEQCMEELVAFHAAAQKRGLAGLILPIVLMGTEQIKSDHPQPEVQLIESLNYISIEDAYVAGYDSPEWLAVIKRIVGELQTSLTGAEERLSSLSPSLVPAPDGESSTDDDDSVDALAFFAATEQIQEEVESYVETFGEFFGAFEGALDGRDVSSLTPGQMNAFLLRASESIKEPALNLESKGERLIQAVSEADASLRYLFREAEDIDDTSMRDALNSIRESAKGQAIEMQEMEQQFEGMLQVLKMLALMNSRFRRSVQPATRSVQALRLAMSTMFSWGEL